MGLGMESCKLRLSVAMIAFVHFQRHSFGFPLGNPGSGRYDFD
jgi:hypothetical protein